VIGDELPGRHVLKANAERADLVASVVGIDIAAEDPDQVVELTVALAQPTTEFARLIGAVFVHRLRGAVFLLSGPAFAATTRPRGRDGEQDALALGLLDDTVDMGEESFVGPGEVLFRRRAGKGQFSREIRHAEKAGEHYLERGEALLLAPCDVFLRLGFRGFDEEHPGCVRLVEEGRAALIDQVAAVFADLEGKDGRGERARKCDEEEDGNAFHVLFGSVVDAK